MARNLLSEHRVSTGRFRDFSATRTLLDLDQIEQAISDYQETDVRPPRAGPPGIGPAYERAENVSNAVGLPASMLLATVINLTQLTSVYAEAYSSYDDLAEFRSFAISRASDSTQVNDLLRSKLDDPAQQEKFMADLIRALNRYRTEDDSIVRPTWVAEWTSLKPFLVPSDPDTWLRAVGKPRETAAWLAVFCYPARRVARLFRPTQLDAGWFVHHFPSPPEATLSAGGHTMNLDSTVGSVSGKTLVSEYLHRQIDLDPDDWKASGRLIGYAEASSSGDLSAQRRRHWERLASCYGSGVRMWMPDFL